MRRYDGPRTSIAALLLVLLTTAGAEAHHPTGGMMPTTFLDGLLSGIGHPILGPDHFAFILGIGLLAAVGGFGLLLPALFVVAMTAGLGLHVAGASLPLAEVLLALSVLAIGIAVVRGGGRRTSWLVACLFALAGILHGYAFAETVIGAERTPILAYVAGLALMQMAIAGLAWSLARHAPGGSPALKPASVRLLGLTIAAVGAVVLVLNAGIVS